MGVTGLLTQTILRSVHCSVKSGILRSTSFLTSRGVLIEPHDRIYTGRHDPCPRVGSGSRCTQGGVRGGTQGGVLTGMPWWDQDGPGSGYRAQDGPGLGSRTLSQDPVSGPCLRTLSQDPVSGPLPLGPLPLDPASGP